MALDEQSQIHLKGWQSFTKLMTFSVVGCAVILLLMFAFLV